MEAGRYVHSRPKVLWVIIHVPEDRAPQVTRASGNCLGKKSDGNRCVNTLSDAGDAPGPAECYHPPPRVNTKTIVRACSRVNTTTQGSFRASFAQLPQIKRVQSSLCFLKDSFEGKVSHHRQ